MSSTPLPGNPPEQVGKYRIMERLGEGGMGTVYLAFDTDLGRKVALKWLKQATPATVERLRQEAHLHARVEHPAVCRLYQVDEWEGWPYLVMQFIQGTTLDQVAPSLSLATKLRIFSVVADGVHAAHRQGLIHRDLKPSNLMVEADGAGGWRPYVMDFGLAREEASGTLTEAGMLLGSPAYMAPEQIRGEWVDVRTDIYGLGATFFEVLTGRPPFQGQAAEIILQAQTQTLPRLKDLVPDLPRDLNTIVETCLATDPARRYHSAAALRDDLLRVLDGEPVKARRISSLERLQIWVHRNRLTSALIALICLSLLTTGLLWEISSRRAQTRAYWAERFGQEAVRMDSVMRFGRMLPPHDVIRELNQVRQRMDEIRKEMERVPLSQGPGHFVLGRGAMLLSDPQTGRVEMERAWALGHRSAEVSLNLGLCLILIYEDEYAKTLGMLDKKAREARQAELRRELRDRGREYLTRARKERGAAFSLVEETRLALADERLDDASRLAQAAYEAEPWRYEALFYLGKALAFKGRDSMYAAKGAEAKADFERVLDLLDVAGRIGLSDDRIQDVRKFVWHVGCSMKLRGLDHRASLECALDACEALHAMNSARTDQLNQHALILSELGDDLARRGQDPEPYYQRAEALMRSVIEAPRQGSSAYPALTRARALERLASLAHRRAGFAVERKKDPRAFVEAGLRFCQQTLDEGLAQWETHQNRGLLYLDLAEGQQKNGQESLGALEHAVSSFRDCANLNPSPISWSNLSEVLNQAAKRKIERNEDPRKELDASKEAIKTSLSLAPGSSTAKEIQKDLEKLETQWRRQQPRRP